MEVLRRIVLLFLFVVTINKALAITTITNENFATAISTCLSMDPVGGLCSSSEYGSMPDWDTSQVTRMVGGTNSGSDGSQESPREEPTGHRYARGEQKSSKGGARKA